MNKKLFENSILEYLGVSISRNGLEDVKCYFQPKGNVDIERFYEYSGIENIYVRDILKEIITDPNIYLYDMSFSNSALTNQLNSCRFVFKLDKCDKITAKRSINRILELLSFAHYQEWLHSIAEVLDIECKVNKYPLHMLGFSYSLQEQTIDALKVYFLIRGFTGPGTSTKTTACNSLTRNALAIICDSVEPELNKYEVLGAYDRVASNEFNTLLLGINADKKMNREFKLYFEVQEGIWETVKQVNGFSDNFVEKVLTVFKSQSYKFKGLAISFGEGGKTTTKLYFRPREHWSSRAEKSLSGKEGGVDYVGLRAIDIL